MILDFASFTSNLINYVLILHGTLAYVVVGLLCFSEAAVMLGFILPGETAVIVGGVLASQHHASLGVMLAVVIFSAITGDSVGYEVGKKLGPKILGLKPLQKKAASIEQGRDFLKRRGMIGVFIGRFTAFLRAMVPGLAGMSGMHYPRFLIANATGGITWGTTFTLLGYFIGTSVEKLTGKSSAILLGVIVIVLVVIHFRTRRKEKHLNIAFSDNKDENSAIKSKN
jgi:membrane protein DedA with SNARE-associated domain